jgi:orotidine-5'-phosphate decarboxylase
MAKGQLIFALDTDDAQKIKKLLELLAHSLLWVKTGFQALSVLGPNCLGDLKENGYNVFLDLKFHDISNTVARDVGTMTKRGAHMINMHASGGLEMMQAARKSAEDVTAENGIPMPILLGVTVLTSMNETVFENLFASQRKLTEHVVYLAKEAKAAGLDGVCASPLEIEPIRKACGDDFVIVTPGIRPEWASQGDQRRFTTPAEAIRRGANYIVVGRPILEATDPFKAALNILDEIKKA